MVSTLRDLSKVGMFMMGIALLIIAGIAVHLYIFYIQSASVALTPLYAYCRNKALMVHENQEIVNVMVLDNRSDQICFFEKLKVAHKNYVWLKVIGSMWFSLESIRTLSNALRKL